MRKLYSTRFALLASASLLFAGVAQAQSKPSPHYTPSAPTMVQAAPGFPTISAEQIARDVTEEFDPRTGESSLVAAPFDPFEQDSSLAASVNLRTANRPIAIDGTELLEDGAILEMKLYYNSPSDDPHAGRGYGDAAFLNGEFAPVVTRDNRILECSSRVENVVYEHQAYYGAPVVGIYRPYRHYRGHYGFADRGFGLNLHFGAYNTYNRGFSTGRRGYSSGLPAVRGSRIQTIRRNNATSRRENARDRDRDERRSDARRSEERRSENRRSRSDRDENRGNATRENNNRRQSGEGRIDTRRDSVRRALRGQSSSRRSENGLVSGNARTNSSTRATTTQPNVTTRSDNGRSTPRSSEQRPATRQQRARTQTRQTSPQPSTATTSRPASSSNSTRSQTRSSTRRSNSNSNRSDTSRKAPTRSNRSSTRRSTSSSGRRQLDFFPRDGYGSRDVVTSRSVDCAREETLRVFLPAERLDAARFDGLGLIVLDREGYETPVFIPPNYIEGFRLAASGQIRPQGYQSHESNGALIHVPQPQYQPQRSLESAPCPTGTVTQADGTCLLTSSSIVGQTGYP